MAVTHVYLMLEAREIRESFALFGEGFQNLAPGHHVEDLWPYENRAYPMLSYLDPWGKAIFNFAQMPAVIGELRRLTEVAISEEQILALSQVIALCERCRDGIHLYICFDGD